MPHVGGQHEIGRVLPHGPRESLDPLFRDRRHVSLDEDDRTRVESARRLKDGLEGEPPPRDAVKGNHGALGQRRLMTGEGGGQTERGQAFGGSIGGSGVDVHDSHRDVGERTAQPSISRPSDGRHGGRVVVRQQAEDDGARPEFLDVGIHAGGAGSGLTRNVQTRGGSPDPEIRIGAQPPVGAEGGI